jgi:hypothetical protein
VNCPQGSKALSAGNLRGGFEEHTLTIDTTNGKGTAQTFYNSEEVILRVR